MSVLLNETAILICTPMGIAAVIHQIGMNLQASFWADRLLKAKSTSLCVSVPMGHQNGACEVSSIPDSQAR